jgi:putative Mg2+ transporter-C (MgtC) family protein
MFMIHTEEIMQLIISLIIGGIIGVEREISSKAAGFRTMILICLGSTLFTIVSTKIGANGSTDRIAANIVTGIGFIGAGVVFKEGFTVSGLTTAATIWITAALGMAIGTKDYNLAGVGAALTIVILFLFEYVQNMISRLHQQRGYRVTFHKGHNAHEVEAKLKELSLKYIKKNETKDNEELRYTLGVFGRKTRIDLFNSYLISLDTIKSFDSWI